MASSGNTITFTEVDEVSHPTATYVYSESQVSKDQRIGRLDTVQPYISSWSWSAAALRNLLVDVFLPAGYPHSVSDDYVPYQIFDSLQAFSSSIAGLLSSRAVLQGVGVGNASASPTSALLLHILQDSSGRIATIFFAHRVGTALEPECKMYRLAADVFNDLAMILDCLSPMIPAGVSRVMILSTAGVLRALCGVSGGSSKASLSAHFAKWGNLAEVNAKDSSQETVISLFGMLVGSLLVSYVNSYTATWLALVLLLSIHLAMNYAAVRAVQMTNLNRQRANIVFSTLLSSDRDLDLHLKPKSADSPGRSLDPGPGSQRNQGKQQPQSQPRTKKSESSAPDCNHPQTAGCHHHTTVTAAAAAPATAGLENKSESASSSSLSNSKTKNWLVLTPAQASTYERIFEKGGALKWYPVTSTTATSTSTTPVPVSESTGSHSQLAEPDPDPVREPNPIVLGSCQIGLSLQKFITSHGNRSTTTTTTTTTQTNYSLSSLFSSSTEAQSRTRSTSKPEPRPNSNPNSLKTTLPLPRLSEIFSGEGYILFLSRNSKNANSGKKAKSPGYSNYDYSNRTEATSNGNWNWNWNASILLKERQGQPCTVRTQLKGWMHVLLAAKVLSSLSEAHEGGGITGEKARDDTDADGAVLGVLSSTLAFLNASGRFETYLDALEEKGWDLSIGALETRSGRRVFCS